MSRINDALKHAQRTQKQAAPAPGTKMRGMLPVAPMPGSAIGWILPGVIGFLIVAASFLMGLALLTRTLTKTGNESRLAAAQPAVSAVVPVPISIPVPLSNAPPPPPRPSPPPPPPEPKLQGIVYATTRPWAIVDGQTVHVGDRLGEFQVKAISARDVILAKADGSRKRLGLAK